jgi:hypothetical protein
MGVANTNGSLDSILQFFLIKANSLLLCSQYSPNLIYILKEPALTIVKLEQSIILCVRKARIGRGEMGKIA